MDEDAVIEEENERIRDIEREQEKEMRNWLGAAGLVVILLALAWVSRSYIDAQAQVNKWTVQRPNEPHLLLLL